MLAQCRGVVALLVLHVARGASSKTCCKVCTAPQEKYYSVDMNHGVGGHCGEACMNPSQFSTFKIFEPNLTFSNGTTCKDLGFGKYDSTVTHGVWPISMTLDLYDPVRYNVLGVESVSFYRIDMGECGQITLDKNYEQDVVKFLGLVEGTCPQQGYEVSTGANEIQIPLVGTVKVQLFRKASVLSSLFMPLLDELKLVTLYKLADGECGQATFDKKYEAPAVRFAGLKEGTCAEQGFTMAVGSKNLSVPVLGFVKVELFKQASHLLLKSASDLVTVYQVVDDECGQASMNKNLADLGVQHAGFKVGHCARQGFSVSVGSKELRLPVVGSIKLVLFQRAERFSLIFAPSFSGTQSVTLYKLSGQECGEATLDKKFEGPAIRFAGLAEGRCADHGFAVPAGSQTMKVPVLGEIKIALFKATSSTFLLSHAELLV